MDKNSFKVRRIQTDMLFTWIFNHLNFNSSPKLCEISGDLKFDHFIELFDKYWLNESKRIRPSFAKVLIKIVWKDFLIASLIQIFGNTQSLLMGIIIKEMIDNLEDERKSEKISNVLIFALVLRSLISILFKGNSEYRMLILAGKIKALITHIVSKKVLRIRRNSIKNGKILNIIGGDLEIFDMILYTPYLIGTPITVVIACLFVVYFFDKSGLIGIGISIFHVPLIFGLAFLGSKFKKKSNLTADKRIKLIENLIEGIKIFKFYAWEKLFCERICTIRSQEMISKYISGQISSLMAIFSMGGVCLSIFVTFYVHLIWVKKPLTLGEVYLIINIYLSTHTSIVHQNIVSIYTVLLIKGALQRVNEILLIPECVQNETEGLFKYKIQLRSALFLKNSATQERMTTTENFLVDSPNQLILNNISFKLRQGKLLAVIGQIGSGKSMLLQALLGEFFIADGEMIINGKISYASEVPWIISGSVKENILMGKPYNKEKYLEIINSCGLNHDLENFLHKDETLIGERGVTLSGGQKSRVNLARSLYSDFDILLLDDPLSAVDSQVANQIFNSCIKPLVNQGKTVILATHQLQFLNQVDKILVLNKGLQSFFGNYSKFSQLEIFNSIQLKQDLNEKTENEPKLWIEEINQNELDEEEVIEKLQLAHVWRYLMIGFKSWVWMAFGLAGIVATQTIYQELIFWCSQRRK